MRQALALNGPTSEEKISQEAIRDQLSRVLESPMFAQSERLRRFLRFTVEVTLAGGGKTLKEDVIGTEVYDRKPPYHPNADSIVRREARRLRSKLKAYYESVGKDDPVCIYYRIGSYMPAFRYHPEQLEGAVGADHLLDELFTPVLGASSVTPSKARKLNFQIVFEGTVRLLNPGSRSSIPADFKPAQSVSKRNQIRNVVSSSERIASILSSAVISPRCPANSAQVLGPGLKSSFVLETTPVVFVLDEDSSVRESLELLIRREGWGAETFASAHEFLAHPRASVPNCLVVDVSHSEVNALDLQKRAATERPDMSIIFIGSNVDIPTTVQAIKAGAVELFMKPPREEALLSSIREALERSRVAIAHEAEMQTLRNCYACLSHREREVMALVVAGLLNKQVGSELGISEITVKAHRGQVMQKMMADSFADLVKMGARLDLAFGRSRYSNPGRVRGRRCGHHEV